MNSDIDRSDKTEYELAEAWKDFNSDAFLASLRRVIGDFAASWPRLAEPDADLGPKRTSEPALLAANMLVMGFYEAERPVHLQTFFPAGTPLPLVGMTPPPEVVDSVCEKAFEEIFPSIRGVMIDLWAHLEAVYDRKPGFPFPFWDRADRITARIEEGFVLCTSIIIVLCGGSVEVRKAISQDPEFLDTLGGFLGIDAGTNSFGLMFSIMFTRVRRLTRAKVEALAILQMVLDYDAEPLVNYHYSLRTAANKTSILRRFIFRSPEHMRNVVASVKEPELMKVAHAEILAVAKIMSGGLKSRVEAARKVEDFIEAMKGQLA